MRGLLSLLLALMVFAAPAKAQQTLGIAAVVNDEAISMKDVQNRMKLIMVSSGLPNNDEIRKRIMPQVVEGLIEEQLKLQEASRNNVTVSDEEVEEGFKVIADQNKFTTDQFREVIKKGGIEITTLTRQIKTQLAWNKYIKQVLHRRVNVSETDVDTRIDRMKTKLGQTEYLAAEIYLPLDDAKRNAETQQFATRMVAELQAKRAPFGAVAAQFSKGAGAENGGSLGWVQQGQLPPDMETALFSLEEGGVSNPIKMPDGLHILHLQKKRTLTEESIPSRDDLKNIIGFERLDRVQQKTLIDLKSAAFIDRRI